ncbi:MAG TPA: pyridoxamine 5'-phosphate oxidase family protein [Casimicrobiaceae bacterium]|nr:pyridoxamine 5'-phosphate oxidase family protein [Casimicrobiaceae bacterium]
MPWSLDSIRDCFEGAIPSVIATCALDGTPNVSYLSQVHYVDDAHVALSFQFFNKTRGNVLANPRAAVLVVDPATGARFQLAVRYVRTDTEGALFESMKAKLAGIASHTGMSGVFRLLGADVYEVLAIESVPGPTLPAPPRRNLLPLVRAVAQRIAAATDLAALFDETLAALERHFGIRYSMLLMADRRAGRLYSVASRGYASSGVGAEIPFGSGVIGVAARECTPIRIVHRTAEWGYGRAVRESAARGGMADLLDTEIPLPGLPESRSQLAVPIVPANCLTGVLFVESSEDCRFGYEDDDALVTVAAMLGAAIRNLQEGAEAADEPSSAPRSAAPVAGVPVTARHYALNDSVFLDDDYLIKGVAGAILWKLLRDYVRDQRTDFSNRELRLDPSIRLPDLSDNLEARLLLLQRRLAERCKFLRIEKTGRGRFRLCVERPLQLADVPAAGAA